MYVFGGFIDFPPYDTVVYKASLGKQSSVSRLGDKAESAAHIIVACIPRLRTLPREARCVVHYIAVDVIYGSVASYLQNITIPSV